MDAWKDLYYDCLSTEKYFNEQIEKHQKAILKLQKDIEENKKSFKKNFDLTIDECVNMSYNKYIKRKESE